ncbi:hypothetical protein BHE74_00018895 [Ensete ventricosum]|nr:hypothetical protein BHE74_00018895 [Ensete ventricosum]
MKYPSAGPSGRSQVANRNSSGVLVAGEPAEPASFDLLIGRKVMTRWPEDNNFYEAVITDYNPVEVTGTRTARYRTVPPKIDRQRSISAADGRLKKKSIVDGRLREKSTVGGLLRKKKRKRRKKEEEKKEHLARARGRFFSHARRRGVSPRGEKDRGDISPEDIRWEGGDPGIIIPHRSGQGPQGCGVKRTTGRGGSIPGAGKGRGSLKNQKKRDFPPSQNGISKKTTGDIEILDTNTLIKEVSDHDDDMAVEGGEGSEGDRMVAGGVAMGYHHGGNDADL